jgi:F-type H+-transporting ATPase subunit epsilon
MSNTIQCDIVSAHEMVFSGKATMIVATGITGELGIAPGHAPLMTMLKPGPVRVLLLDGEESIFFAAGGILEVTPHLVNVLTDSAIRAADLDEAVAKRAKEEAVRELADRTSAMEFSEAQAKLAKALAQLQALERLRRKTKIKR